MIQDLKQTCRYLILYSFQKAKGHILVSKQKWELICFIIVAYCEMSHKLHRIPCWKELIIWNLSIHFESTPKLISRHLMGIYQYCHSGHYDIKFRPLLNYHLVHFSLQTTSRRSNQTVKHKKTPWNILSTFSLFVHGSVLTKERDFCDKLQHHGHIAFPLIEPMLFIEEQIWQVKRLAM
jgi:hypothetical protein